MIDFPSEVRNPIAKPEPPALRPPFPKSLCSKNPTSPKPQTLKMGNQSGPKKRPTCPVCSRPVPLCLCTRIQTPSLQTSVSITILQHSREEKHALNTARIAKLGFKNLTVAAVSDVVSGAQIVVHSLKPDSGVDFVESDENSEWVSASDASSLEIGDRRLQIPEDSGNLGDENLNFESRLRNEFGGVGVPQNCSEATGSNEGPVMTITLSSGGDISSITHQWMMAEATTQPKKPSFNQILANPDAVGALAKGFVVKKLRKRPLMNGKRSVEFEELEEFKLTIPPGSVLLFPNQRSIGVGDIDFEVKHLIVLDGTWRKAKRMYAENPWLQLLPHLRLDLEKVSLYAEVRRQPRAGYLSTIESIVYALKAVGKNVNGLDNLLDVFASMVGDQRRCKDERLSLCESSLSS